MLAGGPGGTGGASRIPLRSRLPRHFPWHSAINIDAARPLSDRKVSAGASGFRKFNIRGMPKLCNSERMLGFWEPGGYGYVRGRPQTNPTLGQVFPPARPGRLRHSPALSGAGQGAQGAQEGLRELRYVCM